MTKTDFKSMSKLDLLDLRMKVNEELQRYDFREKIKVSRIFWELHGAKYFIKKENAVNFINEYWMDDLEEVFEDKNKIELTVYYLPEAQLESCQDYEPPKDVQETYL